MPEVLQSQPPPSPAAPPSASAPSPGIVKAFVGVLTKPAEFWESVRTQRGLGAPLVFALVMGLASGVFTAVVTVLGLGGAAGAAGGAFGAGLGFAAILFSPVIAVIGAFIGGAIVHVISMIAGGKGSYEQSVRVAAYSAAVMPIGTLLGLVPLAGILSNLYGLYLVALGVVALHLADRKRTFVVSGVLAVLVVLLGFGGWVAGRAAKDATSDMDAKFGKNSEFQREMQKASEEMRRAAEELERARTPPAQPQK